MHEAVGDGPRSAIGNPGMLKRIGQGLPSRTLHLYFARIRTMGSKLRESDARAQARRRSVQQAQRPGLSIRSPPICHRIEEPLDDARGIGRDDNLCLASGAYYRAGLKTCGATTGASSLTKPCSCGAGNVF